MQRAFALLLSLLIGLTPVSTVLAGIERAPMQAPDSSTPMSCHGSSPQQTDTNQSDTSQVADASKSDCGYCFISSAAIFTDWQFNTHPQNAPEHREEIAQRAHYQNSTELRPPRS